VNIRKTHIVPGHRLCVPQVFE